MRHHYRAAALGTFSRSQNLSLTTPMDPYREKLNRECRRHLDPRFDHDHVLNRWPFWSARRQAFHYRFARRRFYAWIRERLQSDGISKPRILLAPAGRGADLEYVAELDGTVTTLDISWQALSSIPPFAGARICADIADTRCLRGERFDLIVVPLFFHHYTRFGFDRFVESLHTLLCPGGLLFALEPGIFNPFALCTQGLRQLLGNITGTVEDEMPLRPGRLRRAFTRAGFAQTRIKTIAFCHNRIPVPVHTLLESIGRPLTRLFPFSHMGWMCGFMTRRKGIWRPSPACGRRRPVVRQRRWAMTQLLYTEVLKRLDSALARANIRYMPIKGAWLLANGIAGDLPARTMRDIDLLVTPSDFSSAAACLNNLACMRTADNYWPFERSFICTLGSHRVHVELHNRLNFPQRFLLPAQHLFARARHQGAVQFLACCEDALLVLLLHALVHMHTELRLDLLDEAHLICTSEGFSWNTFWKNAEATGARSFCQLLLGYYEKQYHETTEMGPVGPYVRWLWKKYDFQAITRLTPPGRRLLFELPFVRDPLWLFIFKTGSNLQGRK